MADVGLVIAFLAKQARVNMSDVISDKFRKNEAKYPADLVRGSSEKYSYYKDNIARQQQQQQQQSHHVHHQAKHHQRHHGNATDTSTGHGASDACSNSDRCIELWKRPSAVAAGCSLGLMIVCTLLGK